MKRILFSALAVFALTAGAQAEKLVIKGSDTLGAKLVPQLAEAFKAQNPGTTFEIAAEGSTTGISAIIEGTADIGMSSRRAKSTEMSSGAASGKNLKPTIACYDGIAIVLNAGNPVTGLTKAQVQSIFTGEVTDWSAVGGKPGVISIYTRNTASGTYSDFKELAMAKKDYASSSQKMAGNEQIVAEVAKNANGIGYVGLAYMKSPGTKAIPVGGVLPSEATVQSKAYPYSRPTFYYTNGEPSGLAMKFVEFTHSPAGDTIVRNVGFVPGK
jgi:phosphate transport system substrate-binding protein